IVMPRSRSRSIESRNWSFDSRIVSAPVRSRIRSASVDLPRSICAIIEKLRIEAASVISTRTGALLLEIFERLFEPVGELFFRTPSKFLFRARRRDDRALLLAGTGRGMLGLGREIGDAREGGIEIVHVSLEAGADVERE